TASISTAGLWINERQPLLANTTAALVPYFLQGGKITVSSEHDVDLAAGSVLDASGGARMTQAGKILAGDAGSITLQAGTLPDSELKLAGDLTAYSAGKGGTLSVSVPRIVIDTTASSASTVTLDPEFFTRGGFSQYTLRGYFGLTLAKDTVL